MIPLVIAMMFSCAAVAASLLRLWRVHHALTFDLDALRGAMGRSAGFANLQELRAALEDDDRGGGTSWEAELVAGLVEAATPQGRTAAVNEALHDAGRALAWGAQIAKAAPRCALAGPLGVVFWALARQAMTVSDVLPVAAWGVAGVVASLVLAHEADRVVTKRRRSVDMWVDQLLIAAGSRHSL